MKALDVAHSQLGPMDRPGRADASKEGRLMRTIAIINQKGGCGKTTTSINLAACLARLGQKTLLCDMDPQGHCAVGLAVPEEQIERTIFDALIEDKDGKPAKLADIVWQIASDFDLAPSNIKLSAFEQMFAGRPGREDRLKKAITPIGSAYKWCIIDCPPSVGLITFNALRACDEVIVPVETGYFSLHGLAKMMETLEVLREKCGNEILIRVLPNLYDTRTKLAREVLSELRNKFREYLMESTVNFNTKLKEAASFGQPITEYDPGSRGYKDFVNLARELMGHRPVDAEPTPMEKLSRPAELVQRAKQLAQLTTAQFGKNVLTTPAMPAIPLPVESEPSEDPLANIPPLVLGNTAPLHTGTPMPTFDLSGASPMSLASGPAAASSQTTFAGSNTLSNPFGGRLTDLVATAPAPSFSKSLSSLEEEQADNGKSIEPIRFTEVVKSPVPIVAPIEPLMPKTTAQKIDEFYGCKQVGDEVIFSAHFAQAKKVLIAGDFNNWSPMSTPMINRRPGEFWTCLPLQPGRYRYRFVVDGKWMTDPHNKYVETNQFGELNNVIEVD
jgi:chromosome partitioning protein